MSFYEELKRRNVAKVAVLYVIAAWLLLQVTDVLSSLLTAPEWAGSFVVMLLLLGFFPMMIFSWVYEMTPEGLIREKDIDRSQSITPDTGRKINTLIVVLLVLAIAGLVADRLIPETAIVAERPATDDAERVETADLKSGVEETAAAVSERSIAVLPFVNMSSDDEQEYFSDGISEELLNLLAKIPELQVAARTSSFSFKGQNVEIPEIAERLKVAHVLEGSVRKSGEQIRITVQLIQAEDGYHLWSETYDRTLDDIFAIQDEIAAAVVASLKITLLGEAPRSRVTSAEAYEFTLQGRYFYNRRAPGDVGRALEYFERAVELDPGIVEAWVGLTPLYIMYKDPPDVARARDAAEKALAIDPDNPEAHIRLALVLSYEGNTELSQREAQRAMELGPNNLLVLSIRAGSWQQAGDLERAIEIQTRAVTVDPLHVVNRTNLAAYLEQSGRLDDALVQARKALELSPAAPNILKAISRIRLLQGYPEEAYEIIQQLPEDFEKLYYLANTEYTLGNIEGADATLLEYQEKYAAEFPIGLAGIHAWRGNGDLAFDWLNRAISQDPNLAREWTDDQFLSELHDDPRWEEFVAHWETDN
jgi:adenylate cyclase